VSSDFRFRPGSGREPPGQKEAAMMLAYRLMRLIEAHSEPLASGVVEKLESCEKCKSFGDAATHELKARVTEIYSHLGEWMLGKKESDIDRRYRAIGRRRAEQDVPLSQLIWAIALVKENLVEYLQKQTGELKPFEVLGELEMMQLLEQFFDRAVYYAAIGYEEVHQTLPASAHN
jgi:hypothetical protein